MIGVPFYRQTASGEKLIGWIFWDGRNVSARPSDSPVLQNILADMGGRGSEEEWLQSLPKTYSGLYLWAGKAEEV